MELQEGEEEARKGLDVRKCAVTYQMEVVSTCLADRHHAMLEGQVGRSRD